MILDATCGGRSIWYDGQKENENTVYCDLRQREPGFHGQDGRTYGVQPDVQCDYRNLPFDDETFHLVVFDPPHVERSDGMEQLSGIITKKYGALHAETWQDDLQIAFGELWRVLQPHGTLVFKFADNARSFTDILELAPEDPLFGTTTKKNNTETRWFTFHKEESDDE